jgi:spermidine dehydrogenase
MPTQKDEQDLANSDITRRDFVGGALLGTGSVLLGMGSPAAVRTAAAQTVPMPMTGLGPDWTGPGGIGDYAQSNGNTAEVVNAAHGAIRNHALDGAIAHASESGEKFDLVIVGCGISALAAAYTYHKERPGSSVLMLDQHPIFGGEAKQNEFDVDGYHLTAPQGSTGFVVPLSRAKDVGWGTHFTTDLGFPDEFVFQKPTGLSREILVPHDAWFPMHISWQQSDTGFYYEGSGWAKNPWRNGFAGTPLSDSSKIAMLAMDLYRTPPVREDWAQWLDSITYQQFLTDVMGIRGEALHEVTRYINPVAAAEGAGLGADVISAYTAYNFLLPGVIGYWRYQNGGIDPTDELYLASFPGGNAGSARCFVKKIIPGAFKGEYRLADILNSPVQWDQLDRPNQPIRMRLSSTVIEVVHADHSDSPKGVIVTYAQGKKLYRVHAKAAICAGPQQVNRHICRDIPSNYREAMQTFHHAPMLTVNVAVRNWKFMERLGIASARWFEGFGWWMSLRRNMEIEGHVTQPLDPSKPVVFSLYNPFVLPGLPFEQQCTAARMQLFNMSYREIETGVRAQFQKMFGDYGFDAKRDIAGIVANRWGHAYVVAPPGFFFGKDGKPAASDVIRKPHGRIAFAHSDLSGQQMWETAAQEGERAAQQILEFI